MGDAFADALSFEAIHGFLEHVRTMAREKGHARLVAQIIAESAAFVATCGGYHHQLAVRGDLDPRPFTTALMAIVRG